MRGTNGRARYPAGVLPMKTPPSRSPGGHVTYIPGFLRLKGQGPIDRWKELESHIRAVPAHPAHVLYENPLQPDRVISAQRSLADASMIHLLVMPVEDVEALEESEPGDEPHTVLVTYRVNQKAPFILKYTESLHLRATEQDVELASDYKLGIVALLRRIWVAKQTGQLMPDEAELDDLLNYLKHSTATLI